MADNVLRLTVDSQEYDSKLKRATEGLRRYVETAHKQGDVIGRLLGDTREYVDSIGQMDTANKTARGSLNELKAAFTEFSHIYNQLSDEEKNGDFGKQLVSQLDQLKVRIKDGEKELKGITEEMTGSGGLSGALDQVSSKLGINIDVLAKYGGVLGITAGALKVIKDAFFASEQNIDDWGRALTIGESVYQGFLDALNTGDISGYLSRIGEIVNAARDAYNELDRLSTQKAINNLQSQAQRVENERMRAMLRTGRYIAPNDGRRATMAEGTVLTKEQKAKIAKQLEGGLQKANTLVRSEIDQTTKSINGLYTKQAKELGLSTAEFKKGTSSMEEFDKRIKGFNDYKNWEQETRDLRRSLTGAAGLNATDAQLARLQQKNPYEQYKVAHSATTATSQDKLPSVRRAIALIVIEDRIRKDAGDTIKWFKNNGVQVKVISGDHAATVSKIAARVGVENADKYISLENMT